MYKNIIIVLTLALVLELKAIDFRVIHTVDSLRITPTEILVEDNKIYLEGLFHPNGKHDQFTKHYLTVLDDANYNQIMNIEVPCMGGSLMKYHYVNSQLYFISPHFDVSQLFRYDGDTVYKYDKYNRDLGDMITEIVPYSDNKLAVFDNHIGLKIFDNGDIVDSINVKPFDFDLLPNLDFSGQNNFVSKDSILYYYSEGNYLVECNMNTKELISYDNYQEYIDIENKISWISWQDPYVLISFYGGIILKYSNGMFSSYFNANNIKGIKEISEYQPFGIRSYHYYQGLHYIYLLFEDEDRKTKDHIFLIVDENLNIIEYVDLFSLSHNYDHEYQVNQISPSSNANFDAIEQGKVYIASALFGLLILEDVPTSVDTDYSNHFSFFLADVYPNPVSNLLNVEFYIDPANINSVKLGIYDYMGRELSMIAPNNINFNSSNGKATCQIPVEDFSPGYYFLRVTDGKKTNSKPIIIE